MTTVCGRRFGRRWSRAEVVQRIEVALCDLRDAREKLAPVAPVACAKVRAALRSAEGALRHAGGAA